MEFDKHNKIGKRQELIDHIRKGEKKLQKEEKDLSVLDIDQLKSYLQKLRDKYSKKIDKQKNTNVKDKDQSQKIAQTAKMKDISDFIDAKCVLEDWRSVSQFGLYKCYRNFCTECDTDPLKLGKFNKIISKQYAESEYVCIVDGEPIKVWRGISFQEGVDPWA